MANLYVRSTDGNNADNGSTWALAKATLAGAAAVDAAGDTIWLSQGHAESSAAAQTINLAGTRASPTRVICGNDGAEPPTADATTAVVQTTLGNSITVSPAANGCAYVYGVTFIAGSGNSTGTLSLNASSGAGRMIYESCSFQIGTTNSGTIITSSLDNNYTEWRNCTVKFSGTGETIVVGSSRAGRFRWIGGSFVSGTSSPATTTALVTSPGNASCIMCIECVDFSNLGTTFHITTGSGYSAFVMRDCKLPSGWSGSLCRVTPTIQDVRFSLYNCSAGTENYKLWIETTEGSIRDETTLIRNGGASDGTTPLSWKMASTANCGFPSAVLYSDAIVFWCNSVGSSITADIHILHDSATNLKDNEVWLEACYLGSSSTPVGSLATDRVADLCTTAADQTTESVSWVTTGMANPNTQKLSVSFTPQMRGFVVLRVALAKASKTIYVCPKVENTGIINKSQFQIPGHFLNNRLCPGAFVNIMNDTHQEQIPSNNFIIESTSSTSLVAALSNYFMAC